MEEARGPELVRKGRNQQLVYEAMLRSGRPMRAYELLKLLHADGIRSPLQVYRVLDKLVREGKARKIETLRAFVLCEQSGGAGEVQVAVTICLKCGTTAAIKDASLKQQLVDLSLSTGFTAKNATVELSGLCLGCQEVEA